MAINIQLGYSLIVLGDGVATTFSFDLTKSATITAPTLNSGGIELGAPVGVAGTTLSGASVALSGRTVTVTFSTAPVGDVIGSVFVLY